VLVLDKKLCKDIKNDFTQQNLEIK